MPNNALYFEVYKEGVRKMATDCSKCVLDVCDKRCIYPNDTLLAMAASGYDFTMNGRKYKPKREALGV